jgi:hypothetical protein
MTAKSRDKPVDYVWESDKPSKLIMGETSIEQSGMSVLSRYKL